MDTKIRIIIALVTFLGFWACLGLAGWKGYTMGVADAKADQAALVATAREEKVKVKGLQDEIRNAPMDHAVTDRRLLHATF
jgi:hypothetical protein